jgi:hypothetical protein
LLIFKKKMSNVSVHIKLIMKIIFFKIIMCNYNLDQIINAKSNFSRKKKTCKVFSFFNKKHNLSKANFFIYKTYI